MNRSSRANLKNLPSRRRRRRRGQPKRLTIYKKSYYMRRWLVCNPWIRPMVVFNYAAVIIQKRARGMIVRLHNKKRNKKETIVDTGSMKKGKKSKQLDKYLMYLDYCRGRGEERSPTWLGGGFSSWCAVRIQALWRMYQVRCRFLLSKSLVNQVASIIIQTAWRNKYYSPKLLQKRLSSRKHSTPRKVTDIFVAAHMIQLCWRSFCNRRIYRYFRDLVVTKLKGAPYELLKSIIPNESDLLDKAAGVHARFRLGGWVFPPKVYFKIYTHRPLCDVNAFAPRDYTCEVPIDAVQRHNKFETLGMKPKNITAIRVGAKYFGTMLSTTSAVGTENWYRREERNNWRAIASHLFENIITPPWFTEVAHDNKPKPYHFSQLRRREDLIKHKKRRRRQWMVKAYMMTTSSASELALSDHTKMDGYNSHKVEYNRDDSYQPRYEGISSRYYGGMEPNTTQKGNHNNNNNQSLVHDLVDWSLALNFDEYTRDWSNLGTSMPSDVHHDKMYQSAVTEVGMDFK